MEHISNELDSNRISPNKRKKYTRIKNAKTNLNNLKVNETTNVASAPLTSVQREKNKLDGKDETTESKIKKHKLKKANMLNAENETQTVIFDKENSETTGDLKNKQNGKKMVKQANKDKKEDSDKKDKTEGADTNAETEAEKKEKLKEARKIRKELKEKKNNPINISIDTIQEQIDNIYKEPTKDTKQIILELKNTLNIVDTSNGIKKIDGLNIHEIKTLDSWYFANKLKIIPCLFEDKPINVNLLNSLYCMEPSFRNKKGKIIIYLKFVKKKYEKSLKRGSQGKGQESDEDNSDQKDGDKGAKKYESLDKNKGRLEHCRDKIMSILYNNCENLKEKEYMKNIIEFMKNENSFINLKYYFDFLLNSSIDMYDVFLEEDGLLCIKLILQNIAKKKRMKKCTILLTHMLNLLKKLNITLDHLRDTLIGIPINFISRNKVDEKNDFNYTTDNENVRNMAKQLINEWKLIRDKALNDRDKNKGIKSMQDESRTQMEGNISSRDYMNSKMDISSDIKSKVETPGDAYKKVDTSADIKSKVETPDDVNSKVETPDDVNSKVETPDDVNSKVKTPDDVNSKVDTSEHTDTQTLQMKSKTMDCRPKDKLYDDVNDNGVKKSKSLNLKVDDKKSKMDLKDEKGGKSFSHLEQKNTINFSKVKDKIKSEKSKENKNIMLEIIDTLNEEYEKKKKRHQEYKKAKIEGKIKKYSALKNTSESSKNEKLINDIANISKSHLDNTLIKKMNLRDLPPPPPPPISILPPFHHDRINKKFPENKNSTMNNYNLNNTMKQNVNMMNNDMNYLKNKSGISYVPSGSSNQIHDEKYREVNNYKVQPKEKKLLGNNFNRMKDETFGKFHNKKRRNMSPRDSNPDGSSYQHMTKWGEHPTENPIHDYPYKGKKSSGSKTVQFVDEDPTVYSYDAPRLNRNKEKEIKNQMSDINNSIKDPFEYYCGNNYNERDINQREIHNLTNREGNNHKMANNNNTTSFYTSDNNTANSIDNRKEEDTLLSTFKNSFMNMLNFKNIPQEGDKMVESTMEKKLSVHASSILNDNANTPLSVLNQNLLKGSGNHTEERSLNKLSDANFDLYSRQNNNNNNNSNSNNSNIRNDNNNRDDDKFASSSSGDNAAHIKEKLNSALNEIFKNYKHFENVKINYQVAIKGNHYPPKMYEDSEMLKNDVIIKFNYNNLEKVPIYLIYNDISNVSPNIYKPKMININNNSSNLMPKEFNMLPLPQLFTPPNLNDLKLPPIIPIIPTLPSSQNIIPPIIFPYNSGPFNEQLDSMNNLPYNQMKSSTMEDKIDDGKLYKSFDEFLNIFDVDFRNILLKNTDLAKLLMSKPDVVKKMLKGPKYINEALCSLEEELKSWNRSSN
ncbi:hypothetical protein, conserved [Plasmodium gonderi]|uniref:TFIIS N-terminal domain-containing protein n=1 Tax=Plasmodium gonderi TaxID=77519 RepID=A0A1Y1JH92_PLAGO|nr:hypothetical protein, conserved [Plasmodium gonderi]GAW80122.1 hypothetical protein, conserved [Plasmodium gonderi]